MITVSAPGKLMIFGEHAVVYGHPCIVTAVSQRLTVIVETIQGPTEIVAPQTGDTRFVEAAVRVAAEKFSIPDSGYKITTESKFSGVFGFGSSSAVTVATIFALTQLARKTVDKKTLFDASYQTVLDVQGEGSGFDVAASTFGGTLYYKKGGTTIEEIPMAGDQISLVVGYSGVKANTCDIVRDVAKKYTQYPDRVGRIFSAIAKIVDDGRKAMEEKEWITVGKFMNFNQEYLRDLGVSTEKLETLISAAKNAGAYGAKLSGAGGGDSIIALVTNERKQAVENAISLAGGQVVSISPHEEGVRQEKGGTS